MTYIKRIPLISVVMPTYNTAHFLPYAINSILKQTVDDFEFIIIDDGSSDNTIEIVKSFGDHRITLLENGVNKGISYSLNLGFSHAKGAYIARMDNDDVSEINRFQEQLDHMNQNPILDICGTQSYHIDKNGTIIREQKRRINNEEIQLGLFLGDTSLSHPTIMLRRKSVEKYNIQYDLTSTYAEDYGLYCKYSSLLQFSNIPKPLIRYRIHEGSVSVNNSLLQRIEARQILYRHLSDICNMPFTQEEFTVHCSFCLPIETDPIVTVDQKHHWGERLIVWNRKELKFNPEIFEIQVNKTWQK